MAFDTSYVHAKVAAMRGVLDGAEVVIRHDNKEYTGVRTSLDGSETVSNLGARKNASGAVRLIVSEMPKGHPKAGDTIDVKEQSGGEWLTRVVLDATYEQMRATLRLDYGEKYG